MGSILAETTKARKSGAFTQTVKRFVWALSSCICGMMIDPQAIVGTMAGANRYCHYIIGKFFSTTMGPCFISFRAATEAIGAGGYGMRR